MDEISRGIAEAALTLQSLTLQALVAKGALTRAEALEIVNKSLFAMTGPSLDEKVEGVVEVANVWLEQVREGLQVSAAAVE